MDWCLKCSQKWTEHSHYTTGWKTTNHC